jgi:hypothetical protein
VADVANAIGSACRETGFVYVIGPSVASELVDTVFKMSRNSSLTRSPPRRGPRFLPLGQSRLDQALQ